MDFKLIVIRTGNIQQLAAFYTLLGLTFDYHQHPNTPYHYATTIGPTVLEIYPLAKDQVAADNHVRLGFSLDHFNDTIALLKDNRVPFIREPMQTEFGYACVVADPDGRKIELYKK